MIIDMHMHEMRYSGDSFLRLENMVEIAKRRGLDGICITDHDSMGLAEYVKEYSREHLRQSIRRKQDFRFLSELNFIPCRETL